MEEVGSLVLSRLPTTDIKAGEVGYLVAGIKVLAEANVGDTVVEAEDIEVVPLPGYQPLKPMVFSGIYPINPDDYEILRDALERRQLRQENVLLKRTLQKTHRFADIIGRSGGMRAVFSPQGPAAARAICRAVRARATRRTFDLTQDLDDDAAICPSTDDADGDPHAPGNHPLAEKQHRTRRPSLG